MRGKVFEYWVIIFFTSLKPFLFSVCQFKSVFFSSCLIQLVFSNGYALIFTSSWIALEKEFIPSADVGGFNYSMAFVFSLCSIFLHIFCNFISRSSGLLKNNFYLIFAYFFAVSSSFFRVLNILSVSFSFERSVTSKDIVWPDWCLLFRSLVFVLLYKVLDF